MDRTLFIDMFKYGGVMMPEEPYREYLIRYAPALWLKHEIASAMNPGTIVELGVRAGYSMWAMLVGMLESSYIGYDRWQPIYPDDPADNVDMQRMYKAWVSKLADWVGPARVQLHEKDTQVSDFVVPSADLYHVDAAHDGAGCYRDIETCVKSMKSTSLIVVHDFNDEMIRDAIDKACGVLALDITVIHNEWGDAVLTRGPAPEWLNFLAVDRANEWWDAHTLAFARQLVAMRAAGFHAKVTETFIEVTA